MNATDTARPRSHWERERIWEGPTVDIAGIRDDGCRENADNYRTGGSRRYREYLRCSWISGRDMGREKYRFVSRHDEVWLKHPYTISPRPNIFIGLRLPIATPRVDVHACIRTIMCRAKNKRTDWFGNILNRIMISGRSA